MALDRANLIELGKVLGHAKSSAPVAYSFGEQKYSYADLNKTFREEVKELVGTYSLYRDNKNKFFELMEEVITDVLPVKVMEQYGMFAEVKTYAQGVKPVFTQRISEASRRRAKQFVTKVGLAGRYEVFKLEGKTFEVGTSAYGAACQLAIEEFLDGRMDMADLLDVALEGLDEKIYHEIAAALLGTVNNLQAANKFVGSGFIEDEMDALLSVADSYGSAPATIYCTFEFAAKMIPAAEYASNAHKEELWKNGYIGNYKGHQVVVLRQSFVDETNMVKVIDPAFAWIIPAGADKPIKIAFEGDTLMREVEHDDWSRDLQFYKKVGVAAIVYNNICVYKNEELSINRA